MDDERIAHYNKILSDVAKSSSELERRAEEAERETNKLKKAQYMEAFIGEEFPGVISGMNAYGMYVELENSCEGMVHVTSLRDDFYQYNESSFEMVGERFNKHYKLGESVIIRVKAVDLLRRSVDFEFVNDKREKDKAAYNSNQV